MNFIHDPIIEFCLREPKNLKYFFIIDNVLDKCQFLDSGLILGLPEYILVYFFGKFLLIASSFDPEWTPIANFLLANFGELEIGFSCVIEIRNS